MAEKKFVKCSDCGRIVTLTAAGLLRVHGPVEDRCEKGGTLAEGVAADKPPAPPDEEGVPDWKLKHPECPECGRHPLRMPDGTFQTHMSEPKSYPPRPCPLSGMPIPTTGGSATTDSVASTSAPASGSTSDPSSTLTSAAAAAGASDAASPPPGSPSGGSLTTPTGPGAPSSTPVSSEDGRSREPELKGNAHIPPGLAAQQFAAYRAAVAEVAHSHADALDWGGMDTVVPIPAFAHPGPVEAMVVLENGQVITGTAEGMSDGSGTFTPSAPAVTFGRPRSPDDPVTLAIDTPPPVFARPAATKHRGKFEMEPGDAILAEQIKSLFFASQQLGRSAQKRLGPSEIGTPCDRRLVMHALGFPSVNTGSDGWAAFVGTCIHAGLAEIFEKVSGSSGRYATEMSLDFRSTAVPHGTADLLDRVMFFLADHKAMGGWSLDKLMEFGPSEQYRKQLQIYAYGASQRGEKIKRVVLIGWPRAESSLEKLWIWSEPYDPAVGRDALKRADRLTDWAEELQNGAVPVEEIAQRAAHDPADCKFCPYYQPKAGRLRPDGGCNGKEMEL